MLSSTSPSNMDWGSLSEESMKSKPSIKEGELVYIEKRRFPRVYCYKTSVGKFYRIFRLPHVLIEEKSQYLDRHVAWNVAKFVKRLRWQLREIEFDKGAPIFMFAFLEELRDARENTGVHKWVAMWLFPYFMKKPASSPVSEKLSSRMYN